MTATETETENTPPILTAKIETVNVGLPATHRCARCEAQAYTEIEMRSGARLEFCAHHYAEHEIALSLQAKRIIDHRPYLDIQEKRYRGVPV